MATAEFVDAKRMMTGISVALEKRVLNWLAVRLPPAVNADHLTALGFIAMAGAGCCYFMAARYPLALGGVVFCLAVNWFGDSLDGTVARLRHQERPRYGFYVDHTLDMFGTALLLVGLALSGYMTPLIALALLACYLMLTNEVYLATYCLASFRLAFLKIGPTELRIVLAAGTIRLLFEPTVSLFGARYLLFDVGAVAAMAGITIALISGAVGHTIQLYREEPLR